MKTISAFAIAAGKYTTLARLLRCALRQRVTDDTLLTEHYHTHTHTHTFTNSVLVVIIMETLRVRCIVQVAVPGTAKRASRFFLCFRQVAAPECSEMSTQLLPPFVVRNFGLIWSEIQWHDRTNTGRLLRDFTTIVVTVMLRTNKETNTRYRRQHLIGPVDWARRQMFSI